MHPTTAQHPRMLARAARQALTSATGFVLLAVLGTSLPGPAQAVPFRPDVLAHLRSQGRLPAVVAAERDARGRGLDAPPATAQGWLAASTEARVIPDRQAVVILVDFSDNEADQLTYPASHYDEMLFSVGSYPGGSMRDWYLENSYGLFNVTGATTVWLRMPQTYAYYVDGQAGLGTYPQNAQKLAEDAVAAADPLIDFSQFDNDGPDGDPNSGDDDGIVDAIFVVHAGPGRETTGSDDDIHSHAWAMANPPVVDGVTAYGYSIEPEDGKRGVFGHEFGHVLGLPDLYDTDYSSSGVGNWCMMSFGSWGGGGLTPTHFLAWCKAQLGFLDPTTPRFNQSAASISQIETNPEVYQLWTGGYPAEQYFLVENRQRVGSDVSLPGDGLVITHIDETVNGNSDESHPLVAVEQADGLFNLEAGQGSDAGDPWPGSTINRNFTDSSTPDSRAYGGFPTQVAVSDISNSAAIMTADLEVENQPLYVIESWAASETGGNGDGDIDPAEQWDVTMFVQNRGLSATGVAATGTSAVGSVTIISGTSLFGSIPAEATAVGTPPLRFSLSASATDDGVPIEVVVDDPGGHPASQTLIVGVNDSLGVFSWTHGNVSPDRRDQWHIGTERNHTPGGSYAWKFGAAGAGDYANLADGALYTVSLPLATVSAIRFWHWISSEPGAGNTVWDGGVVEASVDGGPWSAINPDGGYPCTIVPNPASPFPPDMPCYGGSVDWTEARFDLSGLAGTAVRIRFRFGSDGAATAEGWYIDDVSVEGSFPSAVDPVRPGRPAVNLGPPRPNPARGVVSMICVIPGGRDARLSVFDLEGRRLYTRPLSSSDRESGVVSWSGTASDGSRVPSGVYFLRLESGGVSRSQRVQVVR